ncbi:MAG: hypothetical protein AB1489_43325, partial [Acidobacteriota bacterium]
TDTVPSKSEKFSFANGQITFGQKIRCLVRQAFSSILKLANNLFNQGKSVDQVLQLLIPA